MNLNACNGCCACRLVSDNCTAIEISSRERLWKLRFVLSKTGLPLDSRARGKPRRCSLALRSFFDFADLAAAGIGDGFLDVLNLAFAVFLDVETCFLGIVINHYRIRVYTR